MFIMGQKCRQAMRDRCTLAKCLSRQTLNPIIMKMKDMILMQWSCLNHLYDHGLSEHAYYQTRNIALIEMEWSEREALIVDIIVFNW